MRAGQYTSLVSFSFSIFLSLAASWTGVVPLKLLFELHSRRNHHLMAAVIPKEAQCQEENITSKT
jgi:hypothetical protein